MKKQHESMIRFVSTRYDLLMGKVAKLVLSQQMLLWKWLGVPIWI